MFFDFAGRPVVRGSWVRPALGVNQIMQWASSVIVLGITAYFINGFTRGQHLIYEITIASLNVFFYLPALALPWMKWYKGYMMPLGCMFSYLWLTAFIFTAQDYNQHSCSANSPPDTAQCSKKKALESFVFLTFFFTLTGVALEFLVWDANRWSGEKTVEKGAEGKEVGRASDETQV